MANDIIVSGDIVSELFLVAQHENGNADSYTITDLKERIGGHALDISIICSRMGIATSLVSSIGLDASTLLDILDRENVDYSHLVVCDEKTGKHVQIRADDSIATLLFLGASSHICDYGLDDEFLSAAKLLHLSAYTPTLFEKLFSTLECTITAQYNPHYELVKYPEKIDIIFMSPADAMKIAQEDECELAVKEIAAIDPRTIILSDGGRCAYIVENGEYRAIKMVPPMAYDASLYYSSFIGAFLSRYVKTKNIKTSVSFGLSYQHYSYVDNLHVIKREQKEVEDVMHRIVRMSV